MTHSKFTIPEIYPITDSELSDLPIPEQVRLMCRGGAKLVQIRAKKLSAGELFDVVKESLKICVHFDTQLIVNDRVDVAAAASTAAAVLCGVHVGQNDAPPSVARRLLGDKVMIGISTHDLEQAVAATKEPVNYIAYGPIFGTLTKKDAESEVGSHSIQEIKRVIGNIPLVAIGGISADKIPDVLAAGADSTAVISAIFSSGKPIDETMTDLIRIGSSVVNR